MYEYITTLYIAVSFLAIIFLYQIIHIKNKKKSMCGRYGCEKVLTSKQATVFSFPLEHVGIVYFAVHVLFHMTALFSPIVYNGEISFFYKIYTGIGFCYSLYLLFIQSFVLRSFCVWCVLSHISSGVLFSINIFFLGKWCDFTFVLVKYRTFILVVHAVAGAIALGATVVTDTLFFNFLKDCKISQEEKNTMDSVSKIIWTALFVLFITGFCIFLPNTEKYLASSKFMIKVFIVAMITLNGIFLNLYLSPLLTKISFFDREKLQNKEFRIARKVAYASGGISLFSWITVFILGSLSSIVFSYNEALVLYCTGVVCIIIGSQICEQYIAKKGFPIFFRE